MSDKQKKKISKTGIALVGSMLVCLILCLAVGLPNAFKGGGAGEDLDDENTPGITDIMDGGSPMMIFDKRESTSVLIDAYSDGQIAAAALKCDGGEAEFTSGKEIKSVYKALKNILVEDETGSSSGKVWGSVIFTLEDGSECAFEFEDEDVYIMDGTAYSISGFEELWDLAGKE